jgi:hypothetical protein
MMDSFFRNTTQQHLEYNYKALLEPPCIMTKFTQVLGTEAKAGAGKINPSGYRLQAIVL